MNLDDFVETLKKNLATAATHAVFHDEEPSYRCEICLHLGIGNGALADLGDCPICKRYTRLNSNGTCGREDCSRLWTRTKKQARQS